MTAHAYPEVPYAAALRREVGLLRAAHRRGRFPETLHVGNPGGRQESYAVEPNDVPLLDAGLRTDLAGLLLDRLHAPTAHDTVVTATSDAMTGWLTRPGDPTVQDTDFAWMAATAAACSAVGVTLHAFWTVSRTGWLDLRSGRTRTWRRLRL